MKTKLLIALSMILASFFAGCANRIDGFVPPVTAQKLNYTRTGKFSSTTVNVEGLRRDGEKIHADKVVIRHSNAWIPNVEITAEGYERTLQNDEK